MRGSVSLSSVLLYLPLSSNQLPKEKIKLLFFSSSLNILFYSEKRSQSTDLKWVAFHVDFKVYFKMFDLICKNICSFFHFFFSFSFYYYYREVFENVLKQMFTALISLQESKSRLLQSVWKNSAPVPIRPSFSIINTQQCKEENMDAGETRAHLVARGLGMIISLLYPFNSFNSLKKYQ